MSLWESRCSRQNNQVGRQRPAPLSSGACSARYGILQQGSERGREPERALTSTSFRESSERLGPKGATEEDSLESGSFPPRLDGRDCPSTNLPQGRVFWEQCRRICKTLNRAPTNKTEPQLTSPRLLSPAVPSIPTIAKHQETFQITAELPK